MDYQRTAALEGDPSVGLQVIQSALLPHGFSILESTATTVVMHCEGSAVIRSRTPATGISRVMAFAQKDSIEVHAQFGGVQWMSRFLWYFTGGMILFFAVLFGLLFGGKMALPQLVMLIVAPFLPWPVLIPLIAKWMQHAAARYLDTLIENAVVLSRVAE